MNDIDESVKSELVKFGLLTHSTHLKKLTGGRSNETWFANTEPPVVIKKFSAGNVSKIFDNNIHLEWACLAHLHPLGMASEPIHFHATDTLELIVTGYVEAKATRLDPHDVGQYLARLHHLPPPDFLPKRRHPLPWTKSVSEAYGPINGSPLPVRNPVFLHGDPVPANFISSDPMIAVDWQCPAIGDPCDDIAIYLSPGMHSIYSDHPFTAEDVHDFWRGYSNEDVRARYSELSPVYRQTFASYFRSRRTPKDDTAAALEEHCARP